MNLSKKAPNFNKKEDIFALLTEHQVPMIRAAWFIKLSSSYTVAVFESKNKKRQMADPTTGNKKFYKFWKVHPSVKHFMVMSMGLTKQIFSLVIIFL